MGMDSHKMKQRAIIWAYHAYYDNESVKYFDSFMNLMVAYGFYKLTTYVARTVRRALMRSWRSLVDS